MGHEVGHTHEPRKQEGYGPAEEPQQQEQRAEEFEDSRHSDQRKQRTRRLRGAGKPKSFWAPCCMKRKAVTMRSTLRMRGDHAAQKELG
jgi:hypothetical protein